MSGIEKALAKLGEISASTGNGGIAPRIRILTVILYIIVVLSVPMIEPGKLVWMLCFPVIMAEIWRIGYGKVLVESLYILPLVVVIGIFNPLIDHEPAWRIGEVSVSRGWVYLISIVIRGLLTFQALIILVRSTGFVETCRALKRLHLPNMLVTQLFMLYRYMSVLLEEALAMQRARQARGFGRKSYPLRLWGTFAGQLLLRAVDRSKRIHRAMVARGFDGVTVVTSGSGAVITAKDIIFLACWSAVFLFLRYSDLSGWLGNLIMR